DGLQELQQRARPLRKLETVDELVGDVRHMAADHVPDVQLRELVVREIEHLVAADRELLEQRLRFAAPVPQRDTDEDPRLLRRRVAVVEFRDAARADRLAEAQKLALALGDLDGDQRFAMLAELGALRDVAQTVEVDVRAARDRDQRLAVAEALDVPLQARDRERACRLHDHAAVLENILDRGADLVRLDEHDLVDDLLRDRERMVADPAHRDAVGEDADVIERDHVTPAQRVVHARRLDGLDADHGDLRVELLDVRADAGDEPAAADGNEYRGWRPLPLARELEGDRALARDHVGIRERVHECEPLLGGELHRALVRLVVGVPMQHRLALQRATRIHLDGGGALRHHDHGAPAPLARGERDALRVVAGGAADHALRQLVRRHLRNLVERAPALEREDGLQVLALQPDVAAEAARQAQRVIERRLDRDVVDAGL